MTEIDVEPTSPLESSPLLQGERVAFTGTLASMTHRQAMEIVEQHGGIPTQNVGLMTSILVVGEEGWPLEPDGLPSIKLEHARQLHGKGEPIQIVSESEWLKLLGIEPPERRSSQLHTPAMLSQLLRVSVNDIRRWERAKLIRPVKKVYRLPYFDFEEVSNARRLCELVASGVRTDQIAVSLNRLATMMPNITRPLEQLEVLAKGVDGLVFRDPSGLIESSGQRLFDFDPPVDTIPLDNEPLTIPIRPGLDESDADRQNWSAEDWFQEGCRLVEAGNLTAAIEALRLTVVNDPLNPIFHFHLADALYRAHKIEAAIERYHVAVELDHNFIEAWTQLGCVLAETGDAIGAKTAFQIALDAHPDYADAHFHLANILERLNQVEEASEHWQTYLQFDRRGPWAQIAREHLLGESAQLQNTPEDEPSLWSPNS